VFLTSATAGRSAITPLTPSEQAALRRFVERGGGAVIFVDNESYAGVPTSDIANESLLDSFGLDVMGHAGWPEDVIIPHPADHAVSAGVFGLVSTFTQFFGGWFDNLGPHALAVGILAQVGQPGLAVIYPTELGPRSGVAVFFADTSMIWDLFITPENKNIVRNAIAYGAFRARTAGGGDLDGDADADLRDFALLQLCFGGANNSPSPSCPPGVDADLDGDGDVDLADFLIFQQNFTGSL